MEPIQIEGTTPGEQRFLTLHRDHTISIYWNGEPMVTIYTDGHIETGENYTPDAAATAFWDAVSLLHPFRQAASERVAEALRIVANLARCEVSEWDYTHPITVPDDIDQWELIERARKVAGHEQRE